jgi:mannobiose 2-epimerase
MKMQLKVFLKELDAELKDAILPYWMTKMIDLQKGGFHGRIDGRNRLYPSSPKGSVLNGRILWTFSAAYNHYADPKYMEIADRAFKYCSENFMNKENQGVYWMLDHHGKPLDTKNQIYALGFMIYGFSEYFIATENVKALDYCIKLFEAIEKYSFDPQHNGYFEAFDKHWLLLKDLRLSEKDANEKKTMNTHLHILEAYTNLFRIWKDQNLKKQLINLINVFIDKIIDQETYHFKLFFDTDWRPRDNEISFGHDIEGSWLMQEAAEVTGDEDLMAGTRQLAIKMVDAVISAGIDDDGGLYYELKPDGTLDTDKHWWPQAEAMVGLVNAFQVSGNPSYLDQAVKLWLFIKETIIDIEGGEWHFRVNKFGTPYLDEDKAGLWKCPYHNSRACLEIINRLGKLISL